MKSVINIVTVIQARMNSSRLPYKVMMSLAGQPLILRLVERVRSSKLSGCVVVATTTDPSDDPVYELCKKNNINVFRGHPTDLLDRHYRAGLKYDADVVVKIPSDCPLIDPHVITRVLKHYIENQGKLHYVSNLHPATYPDGNDVEAVSMEALRLAWRNAKKAHEREHTTPYIWDNPDLFNIGNVVWETGWDYSMTHRWTIDYEDDYFFIKRVYDELYHRNPDFNIYDILSLLEAKTELKTINSKYNGVNWYRNHLNELNTISSNQTRFL
jgi:spore coat polysaccharide biosynthesis protein SpsF